MFFFDLECDDSSVETNVTDQTDPRVLWAVALTPGSHRHVRARTMHRSSSQDPHLGWDWWCHRTTRWWSSWTMRTLKSNV
jgi:hypothetical protein